MCENILEKRTRDDFHPTTLEIIDLITENPDSLPVGSSLYKVHKYPSDIDIFERIEKCCTINEVRFTVMNRIQKLANKIKDSNYLYLGDFKAGHDDRYNFYIGEVKNDEIRDYNYEIIQRELINLRNQELFTRQEYDHFSKINQELKQNPTNVSKFMSFSDQLRNYYIVRWDLKELLQGYKNLRKGKKIYLFDALSDRSIVKMDLWAPIPYQDISFECLEEENKKRPFRYVEISNWLLIVQTNSSQEQKELGVKEEHVLTEGLPDYATSLRNDITYYLTNTEDLNTLKASKRFWSYLIYLYQLTQNKSKSIRKLLEKLAPLFSGFLALLNSIRTDLELIVQMKQENLPVTDSFFFQSIEGMVLRLKCHEQEQEEEEVKECNTKMEEEEEEIHKNKKVITSLSKILRLLFTKKKNLETESIIKITNFLYDFIEKGVQEFLNKNEIDVLNYLKEYPIPEELISCSLLPITLE